MANCVISAIIRRGIAVVIPAPQERPEGHELKECEDRRDETEIPERPPPEYSLGGESTETSDDEIGCDYQRLLGDGRRANWSNMRLVQPTLGGESSINWRYANQGISLMNLASREFNAASQDDRDTSDLLTRRLYLHGIAYLLQGLPGNLTDEEALSLRYVMPQSLMDTLVNHPQGCTGSMVTGQREPQQSSSILQRIIAGIVVQMFIITQLLLPYVRLLVGQAYRWECQHKAGQRLVCTGIRAAKGVGRRTLQVSQAVRQMNDGKVGWAIDEAALWWIQGLIGGIQQRISGVKLITMDETYMASSAKTE